MRVCNVISGSILQTAQWQQPKQLLWPAQLNDWYVKDWKIVTKMADRQWPKQIGMLHLLQYCVKCCLALPPYSAVILQYAVSSNDELNGVVGVQNSRMHQ